MIYKNSVIAFIACAVLAVINSSSDVVNAQTDCSKINNRERCAAVAECKWTGMADGFCSDRKTWTPSDDRSKPSSGCKAVLNEAGCETWSLCSWDSATGKCVQDKAKPTAKPTRPAPTDPPTPKPTMKPTAEPTASPIVSRKCGEFKTKGGCCGPNYGAGKPCVNNVVPPPGCYWSGSKCLPKKA